MVDGKAPLLVFGATGRQGGSVARALLVSGRKVRAVVRDASSPAAAALADEGVDLAIGSFNDTAFLREAMAGTAGVFSVLPAGLTEQAEVEAGVTIVQLSVDTGVPHLVYSSGASVGERPTGVARIDAKLRIEAEVHRLQIPYTIVRPMIFMEMLVQPNQGLADGQFTFFLEADRPVQLVAVEDIGRFVAAVFADRQGFAGKTLTLASDTVTGREAAVAFSEVSGRPITYRRFPQETLAANPDLRVMSDSLEHGPLSSHADLAMLREINPQMVSFQSWLGGNGASMLSRALENTDTEPRDNSADS